MLTFQERSARRKAVWQAYEAKCNAAWKADVARARRIVKDPRAFTAAERHWADRTLARHRALLAEARQ